MLELAAASRHGRVVELVYTRHLKCLGFKPCRFDSGLAHQLLPFGPLHLTRHMAPITQALLFANIVGYLLQVFAESVMIGYFALWPLHIPAGVLPPEISFQPWQLVTYAFLHGNLTHLLFNMLALYMFGSDIERVVGERRYATYYFICVITAALAQLAIAALTNAPPAPTVGASGGVFGLLLAFGMYFPRRMVMLIFPPVPMRAWLFVTLYGALELFLGVTGTQQGVAHFAHLGGMLGGYLTIRSWRSRSRFRLTRGLWRKWVPYTMCCGKAIPWH